MVMVCSTATKVLFFGGGGGGRNSLFCTLTGGGRENHKGILTPTSTQDFISQLLTLKGFSLHIPQQFMWSGEGELGRGKCSFTVKRRGGGGESTVPLQRVKRKILKSHKTAKKSNLSFR